MKCNLLALLLTAGICLFSRPTHGEGRYLKVEYPPSTQAGQLQVGVTYTMWIPDDVARFRCVIVHQHGAGRTAAEKGATAAYDLHWQALAKNGTVHCSVRRITFSPMQLTPPPVAPNSGSTLDAARIRRFSRRSTSYPRRRSIRSFRLCPGPCGDIPEAAFGQTS